jgi:hypothetical protein
MLEQGFNHDQVATLVGKPHGFVEDVAQGHEQWRPSHLRRLAAAARVSVERLALLGVNRSALSRSDQQFVRDTEALIDTLDSAVPRASKRPKRVTASR